MPFKVPERFRLNQGREFGIKGDPFGAFKCRSPYREVDLVIVASTGGTKAETGLDFDVPWEHVSVHATEKYDRLSVELNFTPLWGEMDFVKRLFWDDSDVVIQFHINDSRKVNRHENTLHLWRPTAFELPLPPRECV